MSNTLAGAVATESEIARELHRLKDVEGKLMEELTILSSRLSPVLIQHDPRPDSPNKEAEAVLSPFGDQIRQARKSIQMMSETVSTLLKDLAI